MVDSRYILPLVICYALAIVFYAPFLYRELFIRPRSITINETGIELKFLFNRTILLSKEQIRWKSPASGRVTKGLYPDLSLMVEGINFPVPINLNIVAIINKSLKI